MFRGILFLIVGLPLYSQLFFNNVPACEVKVYRTPTKDGYYTNSVITGTTNALFYEESFGEGWSVRYILNRDASFRSYTFSRSNNLVKEVCFLENSSEIVIKDYETDTIESKKVRSSSIILGISLPFVLRAYPFERPPEKLKIDMYTMVYGLVVPLEIVSEGEELIKTASGVYEKAHVLAMRVSGIYGLFKPGVSRFYFSVKNNYSLLKYTGLTERDDESSTEIISYEIKK